MISMSFDVFEELAVDRLQTFWDADQFEIEVFTNWLQGLDGCNVDSFKGLVDNFHVNNFSEIEKEDYKNREEEGYYVYADEEAGRYAMVY